MTNPLELLMKPGTVSFLEVRHDNWCPGAHGDPDNCICTPDIYVHQDESRFIAGEVRNRAQRRAAEREAKKKGPPKKSL